MSSRKYTVTLIGLENFALACKKLETNAEATMSVALWEGANVIANTTKPLIPHQTGGLQGAYGVSKHKREGDTVSTYIGFGGQGYNQYKYGIRSSNYAYSYIANTLIKGSKRAPNMKKQNFIAAGFNRAKAAAEAAVVAKFDSEVDKILNK